MTNLNINESKIQFLGKAPKCGHCNKLFSLKKMDETQVETAHETGLCPKCQANVEVLAQFKPVVKSEGVNNVIQMVANENGVGIEDVTATTEGEETVISTKKVSVKPAKQIKEIFASLIDNNQINDAMLESLCDKQYALKSLGGVKYAFLKEVDVTQDIRAQVMVNGKARYSTKVMTICNKTVVMTNDLYEKNLKAVQVWSEQFDMAEAV